MNDENEFLSDLNRVDQIGLPLLEMANLGPEDHEMGVDVKIHMLQPGAMQLPHGPRAKFFRLSKDVNFSINIQSDPSKMGVVEGDPDKIIPRGSLPVVLESLRKYRFAYLFFWFDSRMTRSELTKLMKRIDNGEETVIVDELKKFISDNKISYTIIA